MMSENTIVSTVNWAIDWIQERIKERTSWDGFTIIVISVLVLSASPLLAQVRRMGRPGLRRLDTVEKGELESVLNH
jgi:hypothetical protein